ncbi:hypothetical protein BDY21DRAFT_153980 [Lineolata rhizophorae]|uniref:Uncharacterized protein n=1 Tax=Lineolata rhizophorae TaxID=578093 RepID=A0A6A6NLT2_9PEZI|nr:hypothetical protein BDY21DRAFT_153980 [Lineolata rhizophorae]
MLDPLLVPSPDSGPDSGPPTPCSSHYNISNFKHIRFSGTYSIERQAHIRKWRCAVRLRSPSFNLYPRRDLDPLSAHNYALPPSGKSSVQLLSLRHSPGSSFTTPSVSFPSMLEPFLPLASLSSFLLCLQAPTSRLASHRPMRAFVRTSCLRDASPR